MIKVQSWWNGATTKYKERTFNLRTSKASRSNAVITNHIFDHASSYHVWFTYTETVAVGSKGSFLFRSKRKSIIPHILCHDITLFTFDFAGCGNSEGEYISLGYYEKDDVDVVFKYLRSLGTVSSIGLWGRSMGAVTALMYADTNH